MKPSEKVSNESINVSNRSPKVLSDVEDQVQEQYYLGKIKQLEENGFTVNPKNVGISETSDLGLSVYPNPTNDFVTLDLQKPNGGMYRYKIVDITGKELLVSTIHANKTQISLKSIGVEGVYFMHILDSSNASISIKKIVLE